MHAKVRLILSIRSRVILRTKFDSIHTYIYTYIHITTRYFRANVKSARPELTARATCYSLEKSLLAEFIRRQTRKIHAYARYRLESHSQVGVVRVHLLGQQGSHMRALRATAAQRRCCDGFPPKSLSLLPRWEGWHHFWLAVVLAYTLSLSHTLTINTLATVDSFNRQQRHLVLSARSLLAVVDDCSSCLSFSLLSLVLHTRCCCAGPDLSPPGSSVSAMVLALVTRLSLHKRPRARTLFSFRGPVKKW